MKHHTITIDAGLYSQLAELARRDERDTTTYTRRVLREHTLSALKATPEKAAGPAKQPEKRWQEMSIMERTRWKRANPGQRHPSLGPDDDEMKLAADWAKEAAGPGPSPTTTAKPEPPAPSD
jgi:hypothetical protein